MTGEARFGKLWDEWDARIQAGDPPSTLLRTAKDEDLVEILAGESNTDRKYARDIIATELLNRLRARSTHQPATARAVADSAKLAHEAARDGQEAIHRAEGILKRSGQWDLGASVSASAYASLDATQAAFESAQDHAVSLQETLSRSRVGNELAEDAALKASEGHEATRGLEEHMRGMGKGEEGKAASQASQAIKKAADTAATDAGSRDEALRTRRKQPSS